MVCAVFFFFPTQRPTHRLVIALSKSQREIFEQVKAFVTDRTSSRPAKLSLPNVFPARDRAFVAKLSADLHLNVAWDEYDELDQNLVTWRIPGAPPEDEEGGDQVVEPGEGEDESAWEDAEDDEEAIAAVNRVLKKYEKARVVDIEDSFDKRHDRMVKEKMGQWKRDYYRVSNVRRAFEQADNVLMDRKN